jgi:hypothetical protein
MTKASLEAALRRLVTAARAAVNYEFVSAEKWQPPGSRRSVTGELERALHQAERILEGQDSTPPKQNGS